LRDGAAAPSPPVRGLGATSSPAWSAKSFPAFQNRLRPGDLSWNLIWYVVASGPMHLASPLNPPAVMISDSQTRRRGCRCRRSAADVLSLTTHADSPRRFFHITDDPRNSHARPLYTSLLFPPSDHLAGRFTYGNASFAAAYRTAPVSRHTTSDPCYAERISMATSPTSISDVISYSET